MVYAMADARLCNCDGEGVTQRSVTRSRSGTPPRSAVMAYESYGSPTAPTPYSTPCHVPGPPAHQRWPMHI